MLVIFALATGAAALHEAASAYDIEAPRYGFASSCELEVTKFYCHIAPHDSFCKSGVITECIQIKDECYNFKSDTCSENEKCCKCAFVDCPLEDEGCELLSKKCAEDEPEFLSYQEIHKFDGMVRPGKIPIRINAACTGGSECLSSLRGGAGRVAGAVSPGSL
ncbi:hypothetical protein AAMO2058_000793700 [Amorphochlora amoebiformis]